MKTIFSGIKPTGNLHLGNYIGALSQWVKMQNEQKDLNLIFCVVDLHALTVKQEPKILHERIKKLTALYMACGIDPKKSHVFLQSENLDHTYLSWIFDCITPMGWLQRMTQYKEKSAKTKDIVSVGLFNYPALMAADILLYDTDLVPVGEDQVQHVELARDVADRFNKNYQEIFKLPEFLIQKETARIMSLQNPLSKMSKSETDFLGTIDLLDSDKDIELKIKKAVTDSGSEIKSAKDKPAISNLLAILSIASGKSILELENNYKDKKYSDLKIDLKDSLINFLKPIKEKYSQIMEDNTYLNEVLDNGRDYSCSQTNKKILQVKKAMGLGR